MLATLRPDGFPRISPMEPRFFKGTLWIGGMPGTAKFRDLVRDSRFSLHTATVDTQVTEGDAKVWGTVEDVHDAALHQRFAEALYAETGFDLRGQEFDHFFAAHLAGAAAVEVGGGHAGASRPRHRHPLGRSHPHRGGAVVDGRRGRSPSTTASRGRSGRYTMGCWGMST